MHQNPRNFPGVFFTSSLFEQIQAGISGAEDASILVVASSAEVGIKGKSVVVEAGACSNGLLLLTVYVHHFIHYIMDDSILLNVYRSNGIDKASEVLDAKGNHSVLNIVELAVIKAHSSDALVVVVGS